MEKKLSDRTHRYLDGNLPRTSLTPQELREVQIHEAVRGELQRLDRSVRSPDLAGRVMSGLGRRSEPVPRTLRLWACFWSPRPVRLRPVYGLAVAAVLVLSVWFGGDGPSPEAANSGNPTVLVQFRIDASTASSVRLAGSFTDWQPAYVLHQTGAGVWSVMVPLEPGVHDYAFVVDGDWTHDPVAPAVADGFGGVNSRLLVVLSDEASQL